LPSKTIQRQRTNYGPANKILFLDWGSPSDAQIILVLLGALPQLSLRCRQFFPFDIRRHYPAPEERKRGNSRDAKTNCGKLSASAEEQVMVGVMTTQAPVL
jgi:hypothetical protein